MLKHLTWVVCSAVGPSNPLPVLCQGFIMCLASEKHIFTVDSCSPYNTLKNIVFCFF